MAWHSILYNALLAACSGYALLRGGAPERCCAAIAIVATALSIVTLSRSAIVYQHVEIGTLCVDVLVLAALAGVALAADRFWPLVAAGLQADAVVIHVCKLLRPDLLPLGYAIGLSIWSYPILILIAIGTLRHRHRLAARGADQAWSNGGRGPDPHPPAVRFKRVATAAGAALGETRAGRAGTPPDRAKGETR